MAGQRGRNIWSAHYNPWMVMVGRNLVDLNRRKMIADGRSSKLRSGDPLVWGGWGNAGKLI